MINDNPSYQAAMECLTQAPITLPLSITNRYRGIIYQLLTYLQMNFPQLCQLSELRRDSHFLGWLTTSVSKIRPSSNTTLLKHLRVLRCLLRQLAFEGHPLQLTLPEDFPYHRCSQLFHLTSPRSRTSRSPSA